MTLFSELEKTDRQGGTLSDEAGCRTVGRVDVSELQDIASRLIYGPIFRGVAQAQAKRI